MLITFRTSNYPDITLFGDEALRLLRMMGHSGTVPGALLGADVPAALQRLRKAIAAETDSREARGSAPDGDTPASGESEDEDEPAEEPVGVAQRAFTLIEMLEAAARDGSNVMWDGG